MAEEWKESTVLIGESEEVMTDEGLKYELRIRLRHVPDRVQIRRYDTEQEAMRALERLVYRQFG